MTDATTAPRAGTDPAPLGQCPVEGPGARKLAEAVGFSRRRGAWRRWTRLLRDPEQRRATVVFWGGRLALEAAAEATVRVSRVGGRGRRRCGMRLLLTPSGAANGPSAAMRTELLVCGPNAVCGPDGELYGFWRRGVRLRLKWSKAGLWGWVSWWRRATRDAVTGAQVEGWLAEAAARGHGRAVTLAASAGGAAGGARGWTTGRSGWRCLLADVVLARALGWERCCCR